MPVYPLNQNRQIIVNNADDFNGNVIEAFNVALDNKLSTNSQRGEIRMGTKMTPHTVTADIATIGNISQFLFTTADHSTGKFWAIDAVNAYKTAALSSKFAKDALTNTPTPAGDMIVFGQSGGYDRLIVATSTDLAMLNSATAWNATWWTSTLAQSAFTSSNVRLAVFKQPFVLIIGDGNVIHTIDQSLNVTASRVTLPPNYQIDWIRTTEKTIFIGTHDSNYGSSMVWVYDIFNETIIPYPLTVYGNGNKLSGIPLIHEENLFLLNYDGRLKVFNGGGFDTVSESPLSKKNRPLNLFGRNGGMVYKNKFYFVLGGLSPYLPDGVYVYDTIDNNFYCSYAICENNGDSGQYNLAACGGIFTDGTYIVCGAEDNAGNYNGIYDDGGLFSPTLHYNSYFITPRIQSSNGAINKDVKKMVVKYRMTGSDTIMMKYRTSLLLGDNDVGNGAIINGIWTDTKTITTTGDLSLAAAGFEFIILDGQNAGLTAFITSVTLSSGTYTVVLDTAIGLASGASNFLITNFLKIGQITSTSVQSDELSIPSPNGASEWIQFKAELQGASPIITDIIIEYKDKNVLS
ncbi:MAG: hypothetical protein KGN01_06580 [Patescibacteria group bacterium]|nr:hypothetical protein [Patescibacteria group bacterium]